MTITISQALVDAADGQQLGSYTLKRLRALIDAAAPSESTLSYAAALNWNIDTNPVARVVLTGDVTITVIAGANGTNYQLVVNQDNVGSHVITLSGVTVIGAANWNIAANAVNFLNIAVSNGTHYATVLS